MVGRQASRPDNAVTVPRERLICTKQIHTYSERSSNALTTWYLRVGSLGGCHKWEHHCHTCTRHYDGPPPFSRLYNQETCCCFRTALNHFPASLRCYTLLQHHLQLLMVCCDVCARSQEAPAPAAGCTDTSQENSAPVHKGGLKHGGYTLSASSGALAFQWLGFRCCHFPK